MRSSFLDSRCFWFLYNITHNVVKVSNKNSWLIVDVGASNGWYSKIMQKFLPDANYLLYEPQECYINENSVYAQEDDKVDYRPIGLGDSKKKLKFFYNIDCKGLSSNYEIDHKYKHFSKDFNNQNIRTDEIDIDTLDNEIINSIKFSKFSNIFLKLDIQGAEFDVLKGAKKLLKDQIKIVHMEMQLIKKYKTNYSFMDIISFMLENDFIVFDIYTTYKENKNSEADLLGREGQLTECEIIFIKKELSLCNLTS